MWTASPFGTLMIKSVMISICVSPLHRPIKNTICAMCYILVSSFGLGWNIPLHRTLKMNGLAKVAVWPSDNSVDCVNLTALRL